MKKSMAILLSIVSILTSVAFGFYMKTQDIEFFNTILLIYNRVVDKMKVVYPFYESVIIKKPKKVNV